MINVVWLACSDVEKSTLAALLGVFSVAINLSRSVRLAFEASGSQQPNTHEVPRMEPGQWFRISKKKREIEKRRGIRI
jgi:hypothetical protein